MPNKEVSRKIEEFESIIREMNNSDPRTTHMLDYNYMVAKINLIDTIDNAIKSASMIGERG